MQNPSDCYFFIFKDDQDVERIVPLCVTCQEREKESKAWFWPGSVKGYKEDSTFLCKKCGSVIYAPQTPNTP